MIQNKTRHVPAHLIFFSSQHVHSRKVCIGTFDLHAILCISLKLPADNEWFAKQPNLALQIHRSLSKNEAKWIVFKYKEVMAVQYSQGLPKTVLTSSSPKDFSSTGILTTSRPIPEHWFPEAWTPNWEKAWAPETDWQGRKLLQGAPRCSLDRRVEAAR